MADQPMYTDDELRELTRGLPAPPPPSCVVEIMGGPHDGMRVLCPDPPSPRLATPRASGGAYIYDLALRNGTLVYECPARSIRPGDWT